MKFKPVAILGVTLIPLISFATVPTWQVDPTQSKLSFTATQNGSPITGQFKTFSTDIKFDPKQLAASSIMVKVDISSITTSYKEVADTLQTSNWFDVKTFPQATFASTQITAIDKMHYKVNGILSIKNLSLPIQLIFTFNDINSDHAQAVGSTTIRRTQFQVGSGEWAKLDTVKDDVKIDFVVVANHQKL